MNICIYLLFAYHSDLFTFQNHYQIYYRTISILSLGFLTFQTPRSCVLLLLHILLAETFQIHRNNRAFQSADPSSPRCLCLLPRISRRLNIFEANTKTRTPSTKVLGNLRRVALNIPYLWFTMWYRYIVAGSTPWSNQLLEPMGINFWSLNGFIHTLDCPPAQDASQHQDCYIFRIGDPELNLATIASWEGGQPKPYILKLQKKIAETSLYGKQSHASPCVLESE